MQDGYQITNDGLPCAIYMLKAKLSKLNLEFEIQINLIYSLKQFRILYLRIAS